MSRTCFELAALAFAAVPSLVPVGSRSVEAGAPGFDVADIADPEGNLWTVRAPAAADAGIVLETEIAVWRILREVANPALPFELPVPAGFVDLQTGGRAVVHRLVGGEPVVVDDLRPGDSLLLEIADAIALLHAIPLTAFDTIGLPNFDAAEYRKRRLFEVDRAAGTGQVPPALLTRWEGGLEDVGRWRFTPSVIHGDLVADHVLTKNGRLATIVGWSEAKIADPADDLAWLLAGAEPDVAQAISQRYTHTRGMEDPHLMFRARLAGELSIARYLMHGMSQGNKEIVAEARAMLDDLVEDVAGSPL